MRSYGQFCPVVKSAEILGDTWSILIVRELLLGSTRFSELQRGLPRISPTVLNARLKELGERGIIAKRRLQGQRGHEYRLTPAGRELSSVVEALVVWGMRWARAAASSASGASRSPAPPTVTATATPPILPIPTVPDTAVANAWKWDTSPWLLGSA